MIQSADLMPSLRNAIETYHRSLRRDEATQRHRDPFIHWFENIVAANPEPEVRLQVLLVLVNARFDQGTVAERALENTRTVFEAGLLWRESVSLDEIPRLNTRQRVGAERWRLLFHYSLPKLRALSSRIVESGHWTAASLLQAITGAKVPFFGPKTARLAVRWLSELVRDINIDMSNSEVPIDSLVYRVAARLGLINPETEKYWGPASPAHQKIQRAAVELFPGDPSLMDEPLWMMGRQPRNGGFCYPTNPACDSGCLFSSFCPKLYTDRDPARIGYSVSPQNSGTVEGGRKSPPQHSPRPQPHPPGSPARISGLLVVISCVKNKIWDVDSSAPPRVPAGRAYSSAYFSKNREYAERFGESWCILSAKFGLVLPDEEIENYDFTFKHRTGELVTVSQLREQVAEKHLSRFRSIQVLGGKEYVDHVKSAYAGCGCAIETPLAGLRIGEALQAVQRAIDSGCPLTSHVEVVAPEPMKGRIEIPVPPAIERIADNDDRRLAWHFFVFFSRMEYALKRSVRFLKVGTADAQPNWDKFGSDYNPAFNPDASQQLRRAVDYFIGHAPRKQIVVDGRLAWSEPQRYNGNEPLLKWLLVMIRCVRNNLFHGGKFPLIPISDPSRDRDLLMHAIIILRQALTMDAEVQTVFFDHLSD